MRDISYRTCQSPSHGARELVCKHVSIFNTWLMDLCSICCLVGAGFAPWHVADQSRDEVFMAAQESVGAHRDSQGKIQRPATFIHSRNHRALRVLVSALADVKIVLGL